MKKQRFFTIKGGKYGATLLYFNDLDGAMKVFRFLVEGGGVELDYESVDEVAKPDKNNYVPNESFYYVKDKTEYHLSSEIKDIYTIEEIEKIKKERAVKIKALK